MRVGKAHKPAPSKEKRPPPEPTTPHEQAFAGVTSASHVHKCALSCCGLGARSRRGGVEGMVCAGSYEVFDHGRCALCLRGSLSKVMFTNCDLRAGERVRELKEKSRHTVPPPSHLHSNRPNALFLSSSCPGINTVTMLLHSLMLNAHTQHTQHACSQHSHTPPPRHTTPTTHTSRLTACCTSTTSVRSLLAWRQQAHQHQHYK